MGVRGVREAGDEARAGGDCADGGAAEEGGEVGVGGCPGGGGVEEGRVEGEFRGHVLLVYISMRNSVCICVYTCVDSFVVDGKRQLCYRGGDTEADNTGGESDKIQNLRTTHVVPHILQPRTRSVPLKRSRGQTRKILGQKYRVRQEGISLRVSAHMYVTN